MVHARCHLQGQRPNNQTVSVFLITRVVGYVPLKSRYGIWAHLWWHIQHSLPSHYGNLVPHRGAFQAATTLKFSGGTTQLATVAAPPLVAQRISTVYLTFPILSLKIIAQSAMVGKILNQGNERFQNPSTAVFLKTIKERRLVLQVLLNNAMSTD